MGIHLYDGVPAEDLNASRVTSEGKGYSPRHRRCGCRRHFLDQRASPEVTAPVLKKVGCLFWFYVTNRKKRYII